MTNTTRGLGRGLGELFQRTEPMAHRPPADESPVVHQPINRQREDEPQAQGPERTGVSATSAPVPDGSYFAELSIDAIRVNPQQPRTVFDDDAMQELVESIQEVGLLQPVVVRPLGGVGGDDPPGTEAGGSSPGAAVRFELVMGERRWRACQQAGHDTIPAIVRDTADHDLLRDALLENLHRAQLNPLEEAAAYQQMLEDFGCTQEELSRRIKRSRPQISNTIRLLRLPPTVQRRVAAGVLSAGHARAVLALEDQLAQEQLAQRVVAEGLSVRATEELVAVGEQAPRTRARRFVSEPSELAQDVASRLGDQLDTRVKIEAGRSKGKIVIEYASEDDLTRIAGLLAHRSSDDSSTEQFSH